MRDLPEHLRLENIPAKLKAILEIDYENIDKVTLQQKVEAKYSDQITQKLIVYSAFSLSVPLKPFLITENNNLRFNLMIRNCINLFEQKSPELDEEIKQIIIFAFLTNYQNITKDLYKMINGTAIADKDWLSETTLAVVELSKILIKNFDYVISFQGENLKILDSIIDKISLEFAYMAIFEHHKFIQHLELNNLIFYSNLFDLNQETHLRNTINQLILNGLALSRKQENSLSQTLELINKVLQIIQNNQAKKHFSDERFSLEPQELLTRIIDDCSFYKKKIPLNINNIIEIFNYQKQGDQKFIWPEFFRLEMARFLYQANIDDLLKLADLMKQDNQFLKFILENQEDSLKHFLIIKFEQILDNPKLIKKISNLIKQDSKPDSVTQITSANSLESVSNDKNPLDLLLQIIGIEESDKANNKKISANIKMLDYGDERTNAIIHQILINLSAILFEKQRSDNTYKSLFDNTDAVLELTKRRGVSELDSNLVVISIYCQMHFILDVLQQKEVGKISKTREEIFNSMFHFLEFCQDISLLIEDKENLLLSKIKVLYEKFARNLNQNLSKIIFISNFYPNSHSAIIFLINSISQNKLQKFSQSEIIELELSLKKILYAEYKDKNNQSRILPSNCQNLLKAAISDCWFYQNQTVPISDISQALIIFQYQQKLNCGNVIINLREEFSKQINHFFQNKIDEGFADKELEILKNMLKKSDILFKFLIDIFDDQRIQKFRILLEGNSNLQNKLEAFVRTKISKQDVSENQDSQSNKSKKKKRPNKNPSQPIAKAVQSIESAEIQEPISELERLKMELAETKLTLTNLTKRQEELEKSEQDLELFKQLNQDNIKEIKRLQRIIENYEAIIKEHQKKPDLKPQVDKLEKKIARLKLELEATQVAKSDNQQSKEPEALNRNNIGKRLEIEARKILKKSRDEFGDAISELQKNLEKQNIFYKKLYVTGSQAYVPLLKLVNDSSLKNDNEPKDLDLSLILNDESFDNLGNIEKFIENMLPNFKVKKIHSGLPSKKSISVKLEINNKEIDLNLYGSENFLGWYANGDRAIFSCTDKKFIINNNQASPDNVFNSCEEFLLPENGKVDFLKPNQNAKGFLRRILADQGRLKISPASIRPIKEKLSEEMMVMIYERPDLHNWENFQNQFCQKLMAKNQENELAIIENIHENAVLKLTINQQRYVMDQQFAMRPFYVQQLNSNQPLQQNRD